MPYSHHSHSGQFCKHASGTLEEVVLEAIRQGFKVFGLTEHVPRYRHADLYPEEEGMTLDALSDQFSAFLEEAHRLKALYSDKINLLVGLETEYISPRDLEGLDDVLQRHGKKIEYIVGSVHHVNGIPIDFDLDTYKRSLASFPLDTDNTGRNQQEAFLCTYFDAQYELMQRYRPEVIGHIDLCRLYEPDLTLSDFPSAWEKLRRNVEFAVGYGALFELNAAAFRKGWASSYPGRDVMIQQYHGRFALSDDSHGPHAVGLNYRRLVEYGREADIDNLWFLQSSEKPNGAGRFVHAVKVEGDWREDTFWISR
ncbi:histidinol phosphate phosphatase H [Panus rudis PR-1116 ss-1]|nr:histidinol phosphate phosphatase H [Panus rudis PR-1116 ss-1]